MSRDDKVNRDRSLIVLECILTKRQDTMFYQLRTASYSGKLPGMYLLAQIVNLSILFYSSRMLDKY